MMNAKTTASPTETARAAENRAYVRGLLKVRQPQYAAALESVVEDFMRDHARVRASSPGKCAVTGGCWSDCPAALRDYAAGSRKQVAEAMRNVA